MLKRTPLYAAHVKLGARCVEFGGWEMPVQYTSIVDEHLAVRRAAGVFDISHMGEVQVSGPGAEAFLNRVLTNDVRRLAPGQGQYTLMCLPSGGVVDDLYAYRLQPQRFFLIINASRVEPDVTWLEQRLAEDPARDGVTLENLSGACAAIAIQGPRVAQFVDGLVSAPALEGTQVARPTGLKKNEASRFLARGTDVPILVSRTGYTGEDGFEIVSPAGLIESLFLRTLELGGAFGLKPAGLGARDTLRTEVCYPLYGHELNETTTPIEAGVGFFVSFDKGEFLGRSVMAAQKAVGVTRKCVAFRMTDRSAPPRPGYPILASGPEGALLGQVASGTQSPSLSTGIGMGYVPVAFAKVGTGLEIEIRGRRAPAVVVAKPIYRKPS